jgi:hypothetical protein
MILFILILFKIFLIYILINLKLIINKDFKLKKDFYYFKLKFFLNLIILIVELSNFSQEIKFCHDIIFKKS